MTPRRGTTTFGVLAAGLLIAPLARAGDPDKADALFRQGRAALERGQYVRACELLKKSLDEDPAATGTLLNLAYCHQVSGKLWQAYVEYREAASTATSTERREFATKQMQTVVERLPRIALQLGDERGTRVVCEDGTTIDDPTRPFPLEPGRRVVTLVAPNGAKRELTIDVPARAGIVAVIVTPGGVTTAPASPEPRTEVPAAATKPPPMPPADTPRSPSSTSSPNAEDDGSSRRTWAVAITTLGVAGLAAGTYFGVESLSIRDSACPQRACSAAGLERIQGSATTTAILSTILLGVGVAGAIGGITLFVLPGKSPQGGMAFTRAF
jgi:hypothetical protein